MFLKSNKIASFSIAIYSMATLMACGENITSSYKGNTESLHGELVLPETEEKVIICADLNNNDACEIDEPQTKTKISSTTIVVLLILFISHSNIMLFVNRKRVFVKKN